MGSPLRPGLCPWRDQAGAAHRGSCDRRLTANTPPHVRSGSANRGATGGLRGPARASGAWPTGSPHPLLCTPGTAPQQAQQQARRCEGSAFRTVTARPSAGHQGRPGSEGARRPALRLALSRGPPPHQQGPRGPQAGRIPPSPAPGGLGVLCVAFRADLGPG